MRVPELNVAVVGRSAALRSASAIRRSGISNSVLATAAIGVAVGGLLVAAGWAVAEGKAIAIVALIAVVGVGRLVLTQRGALIGVLLLAAMNGIPGIDTARYLVSHYTGQDLAMFALILSATAWMLLDVPPYRPGVAGQIATGAATLLLLWCLYTVGRTIVVNHVSALAAVAFARDYLYFAVLLLVLPRVRLRERDIGVLFVTVALGVCLYAAAQSATAVGLGRPGTLIHVGHTLQQDGLTRVYADMTDLVVAGLALSIAASLLAPARAVRRVARPMALLLTISVAVQLTRARWVGILVALVLVSVWFMLYGDKTAVSTMLRRRVGVIAGALVVLVGVALLVVPGVFSSGPFIARLTSIFSNLESGGGTISAREAVSKTMRFYLGGRWLGGLGFTPPSAHYFQGLPSGSIEDPDLGVLNAIMPMGAIGAALVYLPAALLLTRCLRRSSRGSQYAWVAYGGAIWIVATLVSSVTLVTFFSTSGLALTAVLLTVLTHPSVTGRSQLALAPSGPRPSSVAERPHAKPALRPSRPSWAPSHTS